MICNHPNREVEDVEDPAGYTAQIYVCVDCGATVEGDPVADRAAANAEIASQDD